jgi:hypothetical protein
MDGGHCRPRSVRFRISEQSRHSQCAVHVALYQQHMGLGEEIRVMFEVLAGRLECVHRVIGRETIAMEAGNTNQQTFDQGKLRGD